MQDAVEELAVSDQVLFIDAGAVLEQGSPAAVIENPTRDRTRQGNWISCVTFGSTSLYRRLKPRARLSTSG